MQLGLTNAAVAAALALTMAACAANPPAPQPQDLIGLTADSGEPPANRCDGAAVQELVGQTASAALLERARSEAGADRARILGEHSIITKEYMQGRLNLVVDDDGRIVRAHCG